MRPERDGAPVFRIKAFLDVLLEGVNRRSPAAEAPEVAARGRSRRGSGPGLDRVGRVGEDDVEGLEGVVFQQLRLAEGVAADDLELLDAVENMFIRAMAEVMRLISWP